MKRISPFLGIVQAAAAMAAFAGETPPVANAGETQEPEAAAVEAAAPATETPAPENPAPAAESPAAAAEKKTAADVLRAVVARSGVTAKETAEGPLTEITYHLSVDENAVEEYRCTVAVVEGGFYASCRAVLPLTIPEERLDDVADALASWNGEQACGRFGMDFQKRAAYFVVEVPVKSLAERDPLLEVTFLGLPTFTMAAKDAAIRAVARGEAVPAMQEPPQAGETPPPALAAAAESDKAPESDLEALGRVEVDVPTCDLVLNWLRERGVEPDALPSSPEKTTFQFPTGLGDVPGIFTDDTVQISVLERWVYALASPSVRVPEDARKRVSRTLLELSDKDNGIAFLWLPGGRVATRATIPAALVDENPRAALDWLLDRTGTALNLRSRELLAAIAAQ